MPLQHYLPAVYLAGFSNQSTTPSRERNIFVGDKQTGKIFQSKASNVGCVNNLYTLIDQSKDGNSIDIDMIWSKYETRLEKAFEDLIGRSSNANDWSCILVPFATCLLVRGPDFIHRFNSRFLGMNLPISADNANRARILELQRLLGPISAAKWIVMKTRGDGLLFTNDLGYCPFRTPEDKEIGLAIPINPHFILGIIPKKERVVINYREGNWYPLIKYVTLNPGNHIHFCYEIAKFAQRFIFGPDKLTIKKYLNEERAPLFAVEFSQKDIINPRMARAHEFTWHRLVSTLGKTPETPDIDEFKIDWDFLAKGWAPPVFFADNLPEFPPSLHRIGSSIKISFYDPELYYNIALAKNLEQYGDFKNVIEECNKGLAIAKEGKDLIRLLIMRGSALDETGNYELALKDFEEALKINPDNSQVLMNKGISLHKLGAFAEALGEYNKAIKLSPKFGAAYVNRGSLHTDLDQYEKAISDYHKGLSFLEDKKTMAKVFFNLGNVYIQLDNYDEAKKQLDQAINLSEEQEEKGLFYFRRAICWMEENDFNSAMLDLIQSIKLKPDYFEAYLLRAQLNLKRNDKVQAISDFTEAIKLAPNEIEKAKMYGMRGIQYGEEGDFENAISDFNNGIAILPEDSALYFNRGFTELMQANIRDSIIDFDRAIELEPTHVRAFHDRGLALSVLGDHKRAINDYKNAINLFGANVERVGVLRNLSISLFSIGLVSEAEDSIKEAERISENDPKNIIIRARIEYARGNHNKSIELFSRASEEAQGKTINLYFLLPLISEGKIDEAFKQIHMLLESNPIPLQKFMIIKELEAIKDKPGLESTINEAITLLS
jgi:tetratricopeptide (TPR) repeat protein